MHTPGPWEITQPDEHNPCLLGAGLYVHGASGPIAFASSGKRSDARLLAAAPELLRAVEAYIDAREHSAPGAPIFDDVLCLCRAAIRKATEPADDD